MTGEKKTIKDFFKKIKIEYVLVAALVVVALILAGGGLFKNEQDETASVSAYVDELERKMENCLSQIKGAGKVEVIVSVSSGLKSVFCLNGDDSLATINGKPVEVTRDYPEISGVVIVAEGANNLGVKVSLLSAAQVYLDIDESKIKVLSMK